MLQFESEIAGKLAHFGLLREKLKNYGFGLGGYWDYDQGFFDATLCKNNGETYYLRLPFIVINGLLDSENAQIQFQTPYVIRHVGNDGVNLSENSLQTLMDLDEEIEDKLKWVRAGEQVVGKVLQYIN